MMTLWWQDPVVNIGFVVLGFFFHAYITQTNAIAASKKAKSILKDAEAEANRIKREAQIKADRGVLESHEKTLADKDKQSNRLVELENRILKREKDFDRKTTLLQRREDELAEKKTELEKDQEHADKIRGELNQLVEREAQNVETAAALSKKEAQEIIMSRMEKELSADKVRRLKHIHNEVLMAARKDAREIIAQAIERYAGETVGDICTSAVNLPSDEMKGRIIGREGRNIRAFESALGVNLVVDETPEVVVISSFDPLRREIARISLERLIEDGRIQPARIEDTVEKVREEVQQITRQAGEDALYQLGVHGVVPELISLIGRLKYRHSYSQNILQHSLETAFLMGIMAAELGLDAEIAKRVGILHDIGKAVDHEVEGNHAIIGRNLLRRHGESKLVFNAVAAHHHDVEQESVYAPLVSAADAISAARPGARSENTENFLKRLDKLERIARNHEEVEECYAIQAGRELRVMVKPSALNDNDSVLLARKIAKQIESEVKYPGQIKVTMIREKRCVEYAQ